MHTCVRNAVIMLHISLFCSVISVHSALCIELFRFRLNNRVRREKKGQY